MTAASAPADSLLPLMVWLSPAFPVGGFAYSHGLETAVEEGLVHDAASLAAWIADLLAHGSIRQDALLAGAAFDAVSAKDAGALTDINDLALALCIGRERRLETVTMGNAFVGTLSATRPAAVPDDLRATGDVAYPVALGAAGAAEGLDRSQTIRAFALAFVANLVSAGVRLGAVGQTDGQRVTIGAWPAVDALAREMAGATLDDLGGCAFRSDLASLQHETQYSRLFRS